MGQFFQSLGKFFQGLRASFLLWLSTPAGQQVEKAAWRSLLAYLTAYEMTPTKSWIMGLVAAVGTAAWHTFTAPASDPVKMAAMKAKFMKVGMLLLLGLAFAFADTRPVMAYDWNVPAKCIPFSSSTFAARDKAPKTDKMKLTLSLASGLSETDLIGMPTVALGYGVSKGEVPSYGFDVAYGYFVANVKGIDDTTTEVIPYFGLGGAAFVDAGDWLHSGMVDPIKCKLGFCAVGPQLEGIVPSVNVVWDVMNKTREELLMVRVPFGPLEKALVHKVCKL